MSGDGEKIPRSLRHDFTVASATIEGKIPCTIDIDMAIWIYNFYVKLKEVLRI
jgi:hypothetical protein